MRALVYHAPHDVRMADVADPRCLEPGDVVVQIELAGLCGSDLHVWHGRERGLDQGTVLGHEFAGAIVEVGAEVSRWRIGHRVVAPFSTSCGSCALCLKGMTARCPRGQLFGWVERGVGLQGAQAQRVRVPMADATLMPALDDVALEVSLLLGDVLATGWHAAVLGDVGPGSTVAVLGLGPVGLCAVLAARERGAARVLAFDSVAERRARAERWGAEAREAGAGAIEAVREATEGFGADAVLECVGSEAASRAASEMVRPGGMIAAVGVHHEASFPFSPAQAYDRNLGLRSGRCPARAYFETLAPIARRHAARLAEMITHRVPLEEAPEMVRAFDEKRDGIVKVVFDPAGC